MALRVTRNISGRSKWHQKVTRQQVGPEASPQSALYSHPRHI
jgi:hypothetical protein